MATLVLRGLSQFGLFELKQGLNRLGRNPANDLAIADPSVSNFHCEITLNLDEVIVRDLGSSNGTFIDAVQIREGMLRPDQTLRLGSVDFRLDRMRDEASEVRVAIPEVTVEQPRTHGFLADGVEACLNHPELPAEFRCTKCAETFCEGCIHIVGLKGSHPMRFCPVCGGPAERLALAKGDPANSRTRRARSVLRRLTDTLKLPFNRGRGES